MHARSHEVWIHDVMDPPQTGILCSLSWCARISVNDKHLCRGICLFWFPSSYMVSSQRRGGCSTCSHQFLFLFFKITLSFPSKKKFCGAQFFWKKKWCSAFDDGGIVCVLLYFLSTSTSTSITSIVLESVVVIFFVNGCAHIVCMNAFGSLHLAFGKLRRLTKFTIFSPQ